MFHGKLPPLTYLMLALAACLALHRSTRPPMLQSAEQEGPVLTGLLKHALIGRFKVPITNLDLMASGRPQRKAAIETIFQSAKQVGWLGGHEHSGRVPLGRQQRRRLANTQPSDTTSLMAIMV